MISCPTFNLFPSTTSSQLTTVEKFCGGGMAITYTWLFGFSSSGETWEKVDNVILVDRRWVESEFILIKVIYVDYDDDELNGKWKEAMKCSRVLAAGMEVKRFIIKVKNPFS